MGAFRKNVIYFDNHIIVAFKEAGILSQGDKTGDASILDLVKEFVKVVFKKKGDVFLGSVHRLDRPVMGLMLFAKTSKALSRLNEQFRNREIKKEYLAIVSGKPRELSATLTHYLEKDQKKNKVRCYNDPGGNRKKAILDYSFISTSNKLSLLKIQLHTGRPHQIRVQLAAIGHPIVGDLKYNSTHETDGRSICLMSHSLSFIHPVKKKEMSFSSEIPLDKDYWSLFSGY